MIAALDRKNMRALKELRIDILEAAANQRDEGVREVYDDYLPLDSEIDFVHGRAFYRDKTINTFLQLTRPKGIFKKIFLLPEDDNELLIKAARDMVNIVKQRAVKFADTGFHSFSINVYYKEIGKDTYYHLDNAVSVNQLPKRAQISVVPLAAYSSTLEMTAAGGVLFWAANAVRRRYGAQFAIKYDYISGGRLGSRGGTFPRIAIGFKKNVRTKQTRRGKFAKKYTVKS